MVLDDLVFHDAHASFLHRHLGERQTLLVSSHGGGEENLIHLLLGIGGENTLGFANLIHLGHQGVHRIHQAGVRGFGGGGRQFFLAHLLCSSSSYFPQG